MTQTKYSRILQLKNFIQRRQGKFLLYLIVILLYIYTQLQLQLVKDLSFINCNFITL